MEMEQTTTKKRGHGEGIMFYLERGHSNTEQIYSLFKKSGVVTSQNHALTR